MADDTTTYSTKILELSSFADTDLVSAAVSAIQSLITAVKALYPVGSVIITTTETNPSTYLGGTWTSYAGGKFLIGADGDTFKLGNTGGSMTHQHYIPFGFDKMGGSNTDQPRLFMLPISATDQNPAFGSDVQDRTNYCNTDIGDYNSGLYRIAKTSVNVNSSESSTAAGTTPKNSIPPYIAVYFWQRTN